MLLWISVAVAAGLLVSAVAQCTLGWEFFRRLRRRFDDSSETAESARTPEIKVAVILCLRGSDPFLADCIDGLLSLDYRNYHLHIVIDHDADPSVDVVNAALRDQADAPVTIHYLTERRTTCSLKCSALVQVVNSLDESYDAIAQVDADTVVHANWLRDLIVPFSDPDVGAVTGNRWYMPDEVGCATLVRWLWNASAVVQMTLYGIPWGGTLAVRMSMIRQAKLNERWGNTFCEDTPLANALASHGKRVAFNPELLMVNRESTNLGGFCRWVSRQLLTVRLYHNSWPMVVIHGFTSTGLLTGSLIVIALGMIKSDSQVAGIAACGFIVYMLCNLALMWRAESAARRIVRSRGEPTNWLPTGMIVFVPVLALLAQAVYQTAMVMTLLARNVAWRGAKYKITKGGEIRLLEDTPYTGTPNESGHSL